MTAPRYWHLRVDTVPTLPEFFTVARSGVDADRYNVRGLEDLGRAIRREARRFAQSRPGESFLVRDSSGNVSAYDPARGVFTYSLPCRPVVA
jgi:hypothetical protein